VSLIIDGSYGYLKVAVSDRVAIERSVWSQLAVLMSLNIKRKSYGMLIREFLVLKIN